ncbi:MAG: riboflavin biosynthesis protein RibF [Erysipelothrix sp.]|nr:riboflavin biosynthesis protein RibF [Erysipelothrix sp.]
MKVIKLSLNDVITMKEDVSCCIGYFDGLHLGHQKLINSAKEFAQKQGIASGLITFDPDPVSVIRDLEEEKKHLYRMEDRILLGEQLGLDYWFILEFTKEVSQLSPEDFVNRILKPLQVKHVACGQNFRFGYKGQGNPEILSQLSQGSFGVDEIELVTLEDEKISSTRIIQALENGDIEKVTQMLGRPYHLTGPVIGGNRQGQKIGFPTANLYVSDEYVLPKQGVYIGIAQVFDKLHPVMINIGHNLTFNTRIHLSIEGNILDFDQVIYGEVISYHFVKYLREELKFNSVQELVERMGIDEQETRKYFEGKDLREVLNVL